jgi:hypothetical protein
LVGIGRPQKIFFLFSLPKRRDTPFLLKETKGPLSSPRESKSESRGTLKCGSPGRGGGFSRIKFEHPNRK